MDKTKTTKEELLKEWREQERKAMRFIKALKSHANEQKVNYVLQKEIIFIDGVPSIKIAVKELPQVKVTKTENDSDDEFFTVTTFDSIED